MQLEGLLPKEQLVINLADLTRGSPRRPHIHVYSLYSVWWCPGVSTHSQLQFVPCVVMSEYSAHPQVQFVPCVVMSGFFAHAQVQFALCVVKSVGFPHMHRYRLHCVLWCSWVFRTPTGTVCTLCEVCGFSAHRQVQFLICEVTSVGFPHIHVYSLCSVWWCLGFSHIHRYNLHPLWWWLWVFRTSIGHLYFGFYAVGGTLFSHDEVCVLFDRRKFRTHRNS
jgi:hypothetical protein